ncbi:energy transducer TonB [Sphingomonas sp. LHG3406-1]|uniref:energy transducer TonB n=1 Tax=Sphingomonas sp. LHG3406-1 TaxID=2804617 RepID=UPI0026376D3D|nr:energy transducer TonB [Sphingomonas sp. LHG3406-1]
MRICWLGLSAMLAVTTTEAAPRQPLRLDPSGKWEVEFADWQCVLRRAYTGSDGRAYAFQLPVEPLSNLAYLRLLSDERTQRRHDGTARVLADAAPMAVPSDFSFFPDGKQRVRQFTLDLGKQPFAKAANELTFSTAQQGDTVVGVPGLATAWRSMEACMGDLYKGFGIDLAMLKGMARRPEGMALEAAGYPRFEEAFEFVTIYWVDAAGRVDDCRLLKPSGTKDFDANFCERLKAKARFRPAVDRNGQPMRAPQYENVVLRRAVVYSN